MYFWILNFKAFLGNWSIWFSYVSYGRTIGSSQLIHKLMICISVDASTSHYHKISLRWLACCSFCLLQVYWRETDSLQKISTPVLRRNIKQFKSALTSGNLVASLLQYLPALAKYCMRYLKVRTQLSWISISMNHFINDIAYWQSSLGDCCTRFK